MRARLERWSAPSSAANARNAWITRSGVLLRLEDDLGRVGWGEASPLPGYSMESLEDVQATLSRVVACLNAGRPVLEPLPASAAFALETAQLDLEAKVRGVPLAVLLGASAGAKLELNTLLPGVASEAWLSAAETAVAGGFRVLKAKIGAPGKWTLEQHLLRQLRDRYGDRIALRLDANGSLPDDAAAGMLAALRELHPEFVEEPSSNWLRWAAAPVPLAVDESLSRPGKETVAFDALGRGLSRIVVLKPALLGLRRALDLAARARAAGARVIVTHLFDGPVGRTAAAAVALAVCDGSLACGLEGARGAVGATLRIPSNIRRGATG